MEKGGRNENYDCKLGRKNLESLRSPAMTSSTTHSALFFDIVTIDIEAFFVAYNQFIKSPDCNSVFIRESREMNTSMLLLHTLPPFTEHITPSTNHLSRPTLSPYVVMYNTHTGLLCQFVSYNSKYFEWRPLYQPTSVCYCDVYSME
ncbi:hypothetical protein TNCV_4271121 [Trichonephila clavipes]|nr:hypothetical protein TNCV_4271121 [Trichonephila clavipes]